MVRRENNDSKFDGLAEIYHLTRPVLPKFPIEVIQKYLGYCPDTIVDLGCGTGLSTSVLRRYGRRVIGVEPNREMLKAAKSAFPNGPEFREGSSSDTGLDEKSADVVICSQSFHWMEPVSALREIDRILKPGGVFAAIDYDWPPVCDWRAERAFSELYHLAKQAEQEALKKYRSFRRWEKEGHLSRMRESGYFRYTREIVFSNSQTGTGEQLYQMALSQSRIQTALQAQPQLVREKLQEYRRVMKDIWGERAFELIFCYRMRIGVK